MKDSYSTYSQLSQGILDCVDWMDDQHNGTSIMKTLKHYNEIKADFYENKLLKITQKISSEKSLYEFLSLLSTDLSFSYRPDPDWFPKDEYYFGVNQLGLINKNIVKLKMQKVISPNILFKLVTEDLASDKYNYSLDDQFYLALNSVQNELFNLRSYETLKKDFDYNLAVKVILGDSFSDDNRGKTHENFFQELGVSTWKNLSKKQIEFFEKYFRDDLINFLAASFFRGKQNSGTSDFIEQTLAETKLFDSFDDILYDSFKRVFNFPLESDKRFKLESYYMLEYEAKDFLNKAAEKGIWNKVNDLNKIVELKFMKILDVVQLSEVYTLKLDYMVCESQRNDRWGNPIPFNTSNSLGLPYYRDYYVPFTRLIDEKYLKMSKPLNQNEKIKLILQLEKMIDIESMESFTPAMFEKCKVPPKKKDLILANKKLAKNFKASLVRRVKRIDDELGSLLEETLSY